MKALPNNEMKPRNAFATKRKNTIVFLTCLFAFPILHKIVFFFGTNLSSIFLAFQKYDFTTGEYGWLSGAHLFDNFKELISDLVNDKQMGTALKNSALLYSVNTFISMPISILCSYFVVKKVPGAGALKVIFFLPSIVSATALSLMFKYFMDWALPEMAWQLFGSQLPNLLVEEGTAFTMLIVYDLWVGFASGIVLYVGSMSNVGEGLQDAVKIDGAGTMGELWHVVLPATYPLITVNLITGVMGVVTTSGAVLLIHQYSAPTYVYTMGYVFFVKIMGENSTLADYSYVAAHGVLLSLVGTPVVLLVKYLLERFGPRED